MRLITPVLVHVISPGQWGVLLQVGLAAGLAATANMRPPPSPSLSHQAATAAAARAAAAFQASRALSMAKGQPLQQGSTLAAPAGDILIQEFEA